MQIVIEISETLKKIADEEDIKTFSHFMWLTIVMDAIKNGTSLPKGHGDLIDADCLREDFKASQKISLAERMDISCIVDHAKPIIEADKAESEVEE